VVGELVDSPVYSDGDVVEYVYALTAVDRAVHRHEGIERIRSRGHSPDAEAAFA
jgi:hypothetical protein